MTSTSMKAILYTPAPPHTLFLGDAPNPSLGSNEMRIAVKATALNRADTLQKRGQYPPPAGASPLLGLEATGTVIATGPACTRFSKGDEVMALLAGGGYAAEVVCHEYVALRKPAGLSWVQAAAIPEAFITAYQALFAIGQLMPGTCALIHGGASGVGTAAIQLAVQAGVKVVATAGTPEKRAHCLQLGASTALNYHHNDFADAVKELSDGKGAQVIVDIAGASHYEQNMKAIGMDGRWVVLAMMGGRKTDGFDFGRLLMKRVQLIGSTLRGRRLAYKATLIDAFNRRFMPAIANGQIAPVIDSVFPWTQAEAAHQRMEANANTGKIVLEVA